ncbi:PLP-dependent aminotransferase family protein [Brevibacillus fulvus]|uniref:2-aminoadipate transaminase n=1 Tax=Brevibacillus fulvus TaxID=1125967 RepID=A0A939BUS7_9BACL|nr:PLP-dependent aminotransferase family protein [Brevibacillus fulvus]MBM7590749.1 2-aminoadipate transaminase [Brevibacillus fulvus]
MTLHYDRFFPQAVNKALTNEPPGSWIPDVPENCIRFNAGYPAPDLVPLAGLQEAVVRLIDEEQDLPLQYLGSPRMEGLRQSVQDRLRFRGISLSGAELMITSGAAQAIDLVGRALLGQEDWILVESPTYMEALEIFRNYTDRITGIPVDEQGIQTDLLRQLLDKNREAGRAMPKFVYTIPSFQNPTGTTMSAERRQQLLQLAAEYDFLIVEDDAYGELAFAEPPVPLKAHDTAGRVIHIGSYSKVIAPGVRIGWIAAPQRLIEAFDWFKKDLNASFVQATVAAYLEKLDFPLHLETLRNAYRARRDLMLECLEQAMPKQVRWLVPEGGYFVWIDVPGTDTGELLTKALQLGVSYVPGKYFFVEPADGKSLLRLSFSYVDLEQIRLGITRLAKAIAESD